MSEIISQQTPRGKQNARRKAARRKKREEAREKSKKDDQANSMKHQIAMDERHVPHISKKSLERFTRFLDPTAARAAELKYLRCVTDPASAPLSGVPLVVGGVPPKSVKLRLRMTEEVSVKPPAGTPPPGGFPLGQDLFLGFQNCSGSQGLSDRNPVTANGPMTLRIGNTLPGLYLEQGTGGNGPVVIGGPWMTISNQATGAYGLPAASQIPGLDFEFVVGANPGVDLAGSVGRLVAQEVRIYPTSNILDAQGTMTLFQTSYTQSTGLNDVTYPELYQEQAIFREAHAVSGWDPEECLRAIRVPTAPEDLNWLPTDHTDTTTLPTQTLPLWACGDLWSVFVASGCKPGTTFRVETDMVLELNNTLYSFATGNSVGGHQETVAQLTHHVRPHTAGPALPPPEYAGDKAIVNAMKHEEGARATAATAAHAQKGNFGEDLLEFAVDIIPEILAMF